MMTKKEWRNETKKRLEEMDGKERLEKSKSIASHLFETQLWKESSVIGVTIARKFELDTSIIIQTAWKEGKRVCVPKCYATNRMMEFREIQSFHELENVYMDLFEPNTDQTDVLEPDSIDLLIVPGLIFDHKGYRIGYGGGYYDRYLQNFKGNTIALAYSFQVTKEIPAESFDIPVQHLFDEKGNVF